MKKYLTYAIAAFFATTLVALASPDAAMIEAKEKAAWQAFKDKKPDDFKKWSIGDMVGVYADGIADMAKELADMQKWDMKSFAISDFKAHSDEKDVMVTNYKVTLAGHLRRQGRRRRLQRRNRLETWRTAPGWPFSTPTCNSAGPATDAQKKE